MGAPPNVLFVISDQLRRQALGCYGDPNVSTPNIDALAAAGTRFTQASSTYPVCVPYRFSVMTGEYAHTRFIPSIEWRMSPAERTLADEFNDAGYDTALFGKWHLYGNFGHYPGHTVVKASRTPVPRPFQGRFTRFAGFDICNDPYDTFYVNEGDPTLHKIDGFQTDGLFDLAIEYLRDPARRDAPFATVLSVEPPHPIFTAPPEYLERWQDREIILRANVDTEKEYNKRGPHGRDLLDDLRVYYAMVENLDDNIGRLITALDELGMRDDTVIGLSADHGELLGCHGVLAKQRPWEESIGVPLILSGGPARPREVDDPVCTEDLFPTLLGTGRHHTPGSQARHRPFAPRPRRRVGSRPRGGAPRVRRRDASEHRLPRGDLARLSDTTLQVHVLGDAHGGRPWQFFDLENDPYELTNLVDDPAWEAEVRLHHQLLRVRMVETYDHYVLAPALGVDGLNEWDPDATYQKRFG